MTESIAREGVLWDGWAVVLVKERRAEQPFAATWTRVLCPPAGSARWYFKRPTKVTPNRNGWCISYKLMPHTYISNDDWNVRFVAPHVHL